VVWECRTGTRITRELLGFPDIFATKFLSSCVFLQCFCQQLERPLVTMSQSEFQPGMVAHSCDPSTQEAEAGGR
jgi:hypothetical protein